MALKHVTTRRKPYRSTQSPRRAVKTKLLETALASLSRNQSRVGREVRHICIWCIKDNIENVTWPALVIKAKSRTGAVDLNTQMTQM